MRAGELRSNDAVVAAVRGGRSMRIPSNIDPVVGSIMRRCWARDADDRPSMSEVEGALTSRLQELSAR